ncbi:MAG: aminoacyl-tRNA deacylase [Frankiales bacterium]|nr:aminoacyl-tRNA deacylase [Frankiales bacterium]
MSRRTSVGTPATVALTKAGISFAVHTYDQKALASAVGGRKAAMADPSRAERTTGYVVGGISPLGQKEPLRTVVDETALLFETVYVSAGRRGADLSLMPGDLLAATNGTTAPIGSS